MTDKAWIFAYTVIIIISVYIGIVMGIFMYKNPLSNRMAFFNDFQAVMNFEKLDKYQSKNQ